MTETAQTPISKFIRVKCQDCGNEQVIFSKASTQVNCLVCGTNMATPQGGKANIKGEVLGVLE